MSDNSVDTSVDETNQYSEESEAEQPGAEGPAVGSDGQAESFEPELQEPEASADEPVAIAEEPATPAEEPDPPAAVVDDETAAEADVVDETVELSDDDEDEDEEPDYFFDPGDWYVVHTYAGYENKVRANLSSRIQSMNMEDKIYNVVVPTEEVMELKSGKMQSVQKKVFPGYILVRMELDDDSWYVVRNTPGVTGFVGSGAKPTPLDPGEVSKILAPKTEDRPKPKLDYEVGEVVSVVAGPFNGYSGPVNAIDVDKQQVTVLLDLFGRETPVELTFDQVTKL